MLHTDKKKLNYLNINVELIFNYDIINTQHIYLSFKLTDKTIKQTLKPTRREKKFQ